MEIYIGIDWSEKQHEIVFLNAQGAMIGRLTIAHKPEGLLALDQMRRQLGAAADACLVGLETAHNLVIDFLWAHGYTQVYVIPPSVTRSCQGRYRQSGARSDETDALLIANLLRTDRQRLLPWHPDSLLTRQLRAKVSLYLHLLRNRVRLTNRLRAVLLRYYPAALEVFHGLDSQIALAFIQAYPTPRPQRLSAPPSSKPLLVSIATLDPSNCRRALPPCKRPSRKLRPKRSRCIRARPCCWRKRCCTSCTPALRSRGN